MDAIAAGDRIRSICLAAYHRGVTIRWFEYNNTHSKGGIPGLLVPLNSSEIISVKRKRLSALSYLALTTVNKQSLVFFSPSADMEPPVLFTADSDLSFSQQILWRSGMIITAPHHGAESNKNAYDRCNTESNGANMIWVRSDYKTTLRPGSSYLNAAGDHYCTICRRSSFTKQNAHLICSSSQWQPIVTRSCHCQ